MKLAGMGLNPFNNHYVWIVSVFSHYTEKLVNLQISFGKNQFVFCGVKTLLFTKRNGGMKYL